MLLPLVGFSTLAKELTVDTCVMQSSSNKLNVSII